MENGIVVQLILPLTLFTIMLGVGMSLRIQEFKLFWQQPSLVFIGVAVQLILLPLLGLAIVKMFQLSPVLAVGVMIVTFAPGGATSNMLTYLARGDTALSVCLTAVSGLITPFTMPVLTVLVMGYFMGESKIIEFPVFLTVIKLIVMSVIPVVIGVCIQRYWPEFCRRIERFVKILAGLFLIMVVFYIVKTNWEQLPVLLTELGTSILSLIIIAMSIGYFIAWKMRLSAEQGVTMSMEVGIQNAAIALMMTGGILQNSEMAASALIYGVLMNIPAFMLVIYRNSGLSSVMKQSG